MKYENADEWKDVVPVPQDEGGPNPLAAIAYTEEYSEAMSYLRAVMAENEYSERAMKLTEHIIEMNPAHYTVWLYRAAMIKALKKDLSEELRWLNTIALRRSKNYQIWQHRQTILNLLPELPSNELTFLATVLGKDAKNYHVWSYRQWLVLRFGIWPSTERGGNFDSSSNELGFTETLLEEDVYNNSAWNHRFFVLFGREKVDLDYRLDTTGIDNEVWNHEIKFAKEKISLAPQNISAWNYLQGVQRKRGGDIRELEDFTKQFADPEKESEVRSSHALDLLAEIWAVSDPRSAKRALELLSEKFDPIRVNYWKWRIDLLKLN